MGDTSSGSWGSDQLGGFQRREEAREEARMWQVQIQLIDTLGTVHAANVYHYENEDDAREAALRACGTAEDDSIEEYSLDESHPL